MPKVSLIREDINLLRSLAAGELHLGEVGEWATLLTITPTITTTPYSENDVVGGKITLANAVRLAAGYGKVESLLLIDSAKQGAVLRVFLFGADLAGVYADNDADAITAVDWLKCLGVINVNDTDYKEMANSFIAFLPNLSIRVKATAGTTLYALIITRSPVTYAVGSLQLRLGMGG